MDTQRINRRDDCIAALFCLICAAALLMVCSMNSWLYPVNPWVDVNIIATVGRGMFHGLVPYRDLVEQKGPLLFLIFGAGMKLTPGTYHGLYLLETLSLAVAMFFGWKTARLYAPGVSVGWMAVLCAAFVGSDAFAQGGSSEEFLLPLFAWSMYDWLRAWRENAPFKASMLVRNGICAGCVLWTKFNLLSFYFVWMAAVALDALVREKKLGPPVRMCLWFLGGMVLASAPWLIYFGANGALGDLVQGYFLDNLFGYVGTQQRFWLVNVVHGLLQMLRQSPLYFAVLTLAAGSILAAPRVKMMLREKATLIAMAVLMILSMYARTSSNDYYALMLAVFVPFALLPLRWLTCRLSWPRWLSAGATLGGLAVLTALLGMVGSWSHDIGTAYADTPQGRVAEAVEAREGATMIQYQSMDMGFYYSTGLPPAHRWFTFLNVRQQECVDTVQALVDAGVPDYVVTGAWREESIRDLDRYEKVLEFWSDYGMREDERMIYCLYRRTEED